MFSRYLEKFAILMPCAYRVVRAVYRVFRRLLRYLCRQLGSRVIQPASKKGGLLASKYIRGRRQRLLLRYSLNEPMKYILLQYEYASIKPLRATKNHSDTILTQPHEFLQQFILANNKHFDYVWLNECLSGYQEAANAP